MSLHFSSAHPIWFCVFLFFIGEADAGHAAKEAGIMSAIIEATDKYRAL
jgi:hypothetical protein